MIEIGFSPVKRLVPVSSAVQSQHLPMMEATGQTWAGFVQIPQHLENTGQSTCTICKHILQELYNYILMYIKYLEHQDQQNSWGQIFAKD